jgi:hypothetical protein
MLRRFIAALGLSACFVALHSHAPACSICNGQYSSQRTLRQDWERAKLVLFGTLSNPRFTTAGAGTGTTDFHIERVLKADPALGNTKLITLGQYIPVLDAKNPPKYVVFFDIVQGKLNPSAGRAIRSQAMLDYLRGVAALEGKQRPQFLQYCFQFLDHADDTLAEDAFLEFVRSSDAEVGQAAPGLDPARLRRLVQDPKTSPERLSLFAFLLGACGKGQDAVILKSLIDRPTERNVKALDGLLCGYIHLQPQAGWDLALKVLADRRRPFPERFAVVRTLRFYQGWKPAKSKQPVLAGFSGLLEDGEMADLAVEDLRRWKMWDLTGKVLAQYGKASHSSPIVRRSIVRYALCCPEAEARRFVDTVRRQDADLVRDLEEGLGIETKR